MQQATTIDKIDLVDISSSDSENNDQENIDVSESENYSNVESASSSNESDSDTDWNLKLSLVFIYIQYYTSLIDSELFWQLKAYVIQGLIQKKSASCSWMLSFVILTKSALFLKNSIILKISG